MDEILEDETITYGKTVDFECRCGKEISKPQIMIVRRIGKGKYRPINWFCSDKCYCKFLKEKMK